MKQLLTIALILSLLLNLLLGGYLLFAPDSANDPSEPTVSSTQADPTTGGTTDTTAPTMEPTTVPPTEPEPADADFVRISDYIPDAVIDLKYATEDNFTEKVIYSFTEPYARYGTVKKLQKVQSALNALGYSLKIWDAFRPPAAQFQLWEICPDPTYVSNPNNGFSSHSRGNTVDITVVDSQGKELEMPTGFDDFSKLADRDYSDCSEETARNAKLLEAIMTECGFKPYSKEWWHYTDTVSYDVETEFVPQ